MTTAFIVLVSLVFATWALRHFALTRALREDPALRARADATPPAEPPLVSVLIPCRNEAHNITRALEALLAQEYPRLEVIVADDRSTDDTAHIIRTFAERDARVRLLECRELPDGWTGKNHALWLASKEARGEVLLFLDADVTLDAGALAVMTSYFVENRLDMLSMLLRVKSHSFWEKTLRVLVGSMLMIRFPPKKVNDPKSPRAFANGQIIMMRTETYRRVGGHETVKSILLEDVALARVVKGASHRLRIAYGFDMAEVRMYSSLREIWSGWSRIFYSAFQGSVPRLLIGVLLLAVFSLSPYAALFYAAALLSAGGAGPAISVLLLLSIAGIGTMMSVMVRVHLMSRCEPGYVALHLPAAVIALFILFSAISRRFSARGIVWKDTRYDLRRTPQKIP